MAFVAQLVQLSPLIPEIYSSNPTIVLKFIYQKQLFVMIPPASVLIVSHLPRVEKQQLEVVSSLFHLAA